MNMVQKSLLIAALLCGLMLPAYAASSESAPYEPLSGPGRVRWFAVSTVGPRSLAAGVVSSSWGTARNRPREYGPHWEGFTKRYGMRLTGVATSNGIEAGLGAAWGEDPRYVRSADKRSLKRIGHAARMTLMAYRADGTVAPAYARYSGIAGSNFLQNIWRVQSQNSVQAALTRTALGFAGKFVSNVFEESFRRDRH